MCDFRAAAVTWAGFAGLYDCGDSFSAVTLELVVAVELRYTVGAVGLAIWRLQFAIIPPFSARAGGDNKRCVELCFIPGPVPVVVLVSVERLDSGGVFTGILL